MYPISFTISAKFDLSVFQHQQNLDQLISECKVIRWASIGLAKDKAVKEPMRIKVIHSLKQYLTNKYQWLNSSSAQKNVGIATIIITKKGINYRKTVTAKKSPLAWTFKKLWKYFNI